MLRFDSNESNEQALDVTSLLFPRTVTGLLAEMDATKDILNQAGQTETFGELPIVVLSAGSLFDSFQSVLDEDTMRRTQEVWLVLQAELATLSSNTDHRIIEEASHYIHNEDPEAVVTAIIDVVVAARQGAPVRRIGEETVSKER